MIVGDDELHAVQAAGAQRAQKLQPERFGLDLAEVQADDLAHAVCADGVGDHQRLGHHTRAVADLDVLSVEPQVRVSTLKRARPELLDMLVEVAAQAADAVFVHPRDPQLLDEAVDLAGADAVDVGLHHDRDDRLLAAAPGLQKARKVRRARPGARDCQLDLADPRLPQPWAIAVEVRHALGRTLAALNAGQLRDLGLHQLAHDQRHAVAQQIAVLAGHRACDDIGSGHHPVLGHRGAPSHRTSGEADELGRHGGRTDRQAPPTPLLPT